MSRAIDLRIGAGILLLAMQGCSEVDHHQDDRVRVTQVTLAEYREFVAWISKTRCHMLCDPMEGEQRDHAPTGVRGSFLVDSGEPVVGVDWYDAHAFAAWRGSRLPRASECLPMSLEVEDNAKRAGAACLLSSDSILRWSVGFRDTFLRPRDTRVMGLTGKRVSTWCSDNAADTARAHLSGENWYLRRSCSSILGPIYSAPKQYRHSTVGIAVVDAPQNR